MGSKLRLYSPEFSVSPQQQKYMSELFDVKEWYGFPVSPCGTWWGSDITRKKVWCFLLPAGCTQCIHRYLAYSVDNLEVFAQRVTCSIYGGEIWRGGVN